MGIGDTTSLQNQQVRVGITATRLLGKTFIAASIVVSSALFISSRRTNPDGMTVRSFWRCINGNLTTVPRWKNRTRVVHHRHPTTDSKSVIEHSRSTTKLSDTGSLLGCGRGIVSYSIFSTQVRQKQTGRSSGRE